MLQLVLQASGSRPLQVVLPTPGSRLLHLDSMITFVNIVVMCVACMLYSKCWVLVLCWVMLFVRCMSAVLCGFNFQYAGQLWLDKLHGPYVLYAGQGGNKLVIYASAYTHHKMWNNAKYQLHITVDVLYTVHTHHNSIQQLMFCTQCILIITPYNSWCFVHSVPRAIKGQLSSLIYLVIYSTFWYIFHTKGQL